MKDKTCVDCDTEMVENAETSELICQSCGRVERLIGVVFDKSQFYNQEGQTEQIPADKSDAYLRKIP